MSFLKISDPTKRDLIVNEFLKTKRSIRQNVLEEKLGDIGLQRELSKLYKPITESQSGLASQLSAIKESSLAATRALKALPSTLSTTLSTQLKSVTFPQYPSIQAYEEPAEPEGAAQTIELGDLATKYLQQYAANKKEVDTTFGIYSKDGQFYIGTSPITIQGDDIVVGTEGGPKTYAGTPGLWELITLSKPNKTIYTATDLENYASILDTTNAIRNPTNPNKPRSSRSDKYREIIKPIWEKLSYRGEVVQLTPTRTTSGSTTKSVSKPASGKGVDAPVGTPIILPSDPNVLVEMLSLRLAGIRAGNTGAISEATAISDELLRQGVISKDGYKAIMFQIATG